MERYFRYSTYLKQKYGHKTYKLPVNLPVTCPNRDGTLGQEGCAFCGEQGAGFETLPASVEVREQLERNRTYIGKRYGARHFIAYFQNFTNTYLPLDRLVDCVREALHVDGVVEVCLSTRPDCINEEYLRALTETIAAEQPDINLSIELGLQTVNYHTLAVVNRGHTLAEFIDAVLTCRHYEVEVGVHLILNLPGDDLLDAVENAKILSALKVNTVKLHALYICEGTRLAEQFRAGSLQLIALPEYIERVIAFLEHLDPRIAVQRLLGRAPEENTLFVNWGHSWWKIHDMILEEMERRDSYQGKRFDYLQGKALRRFSC